MTKRFSDNLSNAMLMIHEIKSALARGTKHYSKDGKLLETPDEIIAALVKDGEIDFVPVGSEEVPENDRYPKI